MQLKRKKKRKNAFFSSSSSVAYFRLLLYIFFFLFNKIIILNYLLYSLENKNSYGEYAHKVYILNYLFTYMKYLCIYIYIYAEILMQKIFQIYD